MESYNASSIKTMEGLDHVRAKPGMWGFIPDTTHGNLMQIKETLDNSVDECLDPLKQYVIEITFFVKGADYQVAVRDFGRGIPLEKLKDIFTTLFTSGKYEDGVYEASVGTNGVGSKVTAALSKRFVALTKRADGFGFIEVKQGKTSDLCFVKKPKDRAAATNGTIVYFEPDPSVLKATGEFISSGGIEEHIGLDKFIDTFSKNITIIVRKESKLIPESFWKKDRQEIWEFLSDKHGELVYETDPNRTPMQYVQEMFGLSDKITWELGKLSKVQREQSSEDRLGFNIELFMDAKSMSKHGLLAAINRTPIDKPDSSHLKVLSTMLKQYLVSFIEDKDIALFFENHYDLPISGSVLVDWRRAAFVGQDKRQFKDTDFEIAFRGALRKQLNTRPPELWETAFELMAEDIAEKFNKYFNKSLKLGKSLKDIKLNHPGSYASCKSKDSSIIELFITEGDSAGGRVQEVRDEFFQAIYKMRGKPFNAVKGPADKLNANLIYQDIVALLGVSPKDTNLDKMRFSRIIITTDADYDGKHITALVIGMIMQINPRIISEGKVYIANPPLYGIATKNKTIFLRDQAAMDEIRIDTLYRELFDIELEYGKVCESLTHDQFIALCRRVVLIGRIANNLSKTLNVSPRTLERLLHVVDLIDGDDAKLPKICEILSVDNAIYQRNTNSLILVVEQIEEVIPLDNLVKELKAYLLPLYAQMHWDKINLYCTTRHSEKYLHEPTTPIKLYEDFSTLDGLFTLSRYKGLGEMPADDLFFTCVDPKTRCFTRVTSIGSVDRIYDMLGVNTDARKRLIENDYISHDSLE